MVDSTTALWFEKIWKFLSIGNSHSILLLGNFKRRTLAKLFGTLRAMSTRIIIFPGGCTSVLQPCDVSISKPFKSRLQAKCTKWKSEMYALIEYHGKVSIPVRVLVLQWLKEAREELFYCRSKLTLQCRLHIRREYEYQCF